MIEQTRQSEPLRHRLYFWLMNLCLFFATLGLLDLFIDPFAEGEWPLWYAILGGLTTFFTGFVPLFLMVAKFMRDDYTEALWRRSLIVMAYGAAVVPPVLVTAPWLLYFALGGDGSLRPDFYIAFEDAFYEGSVAPYVVVGRVWLTFMLLFVGVFQFLRWRDAR